MATTAYHEARITALYAALAELDDLVNQSDLGRSLDFDGKAERLMKQIEWHKAQLTDDEGPFEFETQIL
jgi:hypothetical protein